MRRGGGLLANVGRVRDADRARDLDRDGGEDVAAGVEHDDVEGLQRIGRLGGPDAHDAP
jgi:general stress protein YciG